MGRKNHYQLSAELLATVQDARQHDKRGEVVRKTQALYDLHCGAKLSDVETKAGVSRITLWQWHRQLVTAGLDRLADQTHGRGRHRKATPAYQEAVEQTLATAPSEQGYDFAVWTIERLSHHLAEQTGIRLSPRTLGELLKQLGYVYRRPTYTLKHLQDPAAVAQAKAHLEELKKGGAQASTNSSLWTKPPARVTPTSASAG